MKKFLIVLLFIIGITAAVGLTHHWDDVTKFFKDTFHYEQVENKPNDETPEGEESTDEPSEDENVDEEPNDDELIPDYDIVATVSVGKYIFR